MALRAMCKYSTLLTPSPSGEGPTSWWPYWYRLLVNESLMFPMRTSLSWHGARVSLISVEPPPLSQGGGTTAGLAVLGGWHVGAITDNSKSSLLDSSNHCVHRLRWSLVWAVSCMLWAVLARARAAYSSILATRVRVTPAYLPSQLARSFSGISSVSCDMNLYSVHVEWSSSLLQGAGSLLASTSEAHWPTSPNSCMSCCLIIMPLVGVMSFNHIQILWGQHYDEATTRDDPRD